MSTADPWMIVATAVTVHTSLVLGILLLPLRKGPPRAQTVTNRDVRGVASPPPSADTSVLRHRTRRTPLSALASPATPQELLKQAHNPPRDELREKWLLNERRVYGLRATRAFKFTNFVNACIAGATSTAALVTAYKSGPLCKAWLLGVGRDGPGGGVGSSSESTGSAPAAVTAAQTAWDWVLSNASARAGPPEQCASEVSAWITMSLAVVAGYVAVELPLVTVAKLRWGSFDPDALTPIFHAVILAAFASVMWLGTGSLIALWGIHSEITAAVMGVEDYLEHRGFSERWPSTFLAVTIVGTVVFAFQRLVVFVGLLGVSLAELWTLASHTASPHAGSASGAAHDDAAGGWTPVAQFGLQVAFLVAGCWFNAVFWVARWRWLRHTWQMSRFGR